MFQQLPEKEIPFKYSRRINIRNKLLNAAVMFKWVVRTIIHLIQQWTERYDGWYRLSLLG